MAAPIQFAQVGVQPQIVYQQPQLSSQQQQVFTQKKRFPGEDQCKLFVGGLNYETNSDDFKQYFEQFGEVIDSIIMIDKGTNKPRGFGFVTFQSEDDMEKCLAHEGPHILDDRRVDIKRAVAQGQLPQQQFNEQKVRAGESGNTQFKGPMKIASDLKIFVGGIAPGTDAADVQKYFEDFGTVIDVNLPQDHMTQNFRGFGFVGFETTEVVAAVTKNRYHQINGKTVEVKGCDEQDRYMKNKRDTNRYGDQHQQRIQSVVPAVQTALPQLTYQAQAAQALQYQLAGLSAAAAQPTAAGAGYTVIPAGYSYDPTTGMIYQAAVPAQPQLATAGQQLTGQQQLIQYLQQQQQLASLQMAGQQYTLAAPGSMAGGVTSVAQAAPAYQQISLGQYSQESSAFGAQRILQAAAGGATTQLTTADSVMYQPAASAADIYAQQTQAADQRSTSRSSFHPYGR